MSSIKFWKVKHFTFFLVISAFVISLISLKYFPVPYFWIALTWFLIALYGLIAGTNSTIKAVSINVGAAILAFGIFEGYLSYKINESVRVYEEGYFVPHEFLGTGPRKGIKRFSARRYFNKNLLSESVYTIDSDGLRMGPPTNNSNRNAKCVLFFGCSFTFGEGLNDDETMPYLVGVKSKGEYHTYNFGFQGYGPHQMLAALEHGLEEKIMDCKPNYAIYQAITDHVRRSAGLVSWDKNGPRYILNQNGEVIFTGRFIDNIGFVDSMFSRIIKQLNKSLILKTTLLKERSVNNDEINLYIAIVDKARTIFEARYPGSEFHVLFWDKFEGVEKDETEILRKLLLRGLYNKGIRIHLISNILPGNNKSAYIIDEYDGHPNAFADKLIAEYVIKNILEK